MLLLGEIDQALKLRLLNMRLLNHVLLLVVAMRQYTLKLTN